MARLVRSRDRWCAALAWVLATAEVGLAAEPTPADAPTLAALAARLDRLERENAALAAENRELSRRIDAITRRPDPPANPNFPLTATAVTPAANDEPIEQVPAPEPSVAATDILVSQPGFGGYDTDRGAFVLARSAPGRHPPFELRADVFTQVRYTNFGRTASAWTDSTGATLPVRNLSSIEVTRNFVQLAGSALDPRLQFTVNIFSSTALNDTVYLGWVNYRFSDAFDLRAGSWVVPGTREWYESFRYTLGADRLMATTFFRPNISPGVWAQGTPAEGVHYVAMVANSLNRFTQGVDRAGSSRAFGGTVWWEPWGEYGPGPSDVENRETPRVRVGTSMAFSQEANQGVTDDALTNPEDTIVRLSDGTPLFRLGALAPGTQIASTRINLWAIDAGVKYQGLSVSGEYFFRLLNGFEMARGQSPFPSLFDHGGLLQGGAFVIPTRWEMFARSSAVAGRFGTGYEYGGGVNWYPRGTREWRMTGEVLSVHNSPAQNLLTGYRAGASGTLFQLQCFVDF